MIDHKMPNGASIGDWLGTAATAASVSASMLHGIREGRTRHGARTDLSIVEGRLLDALSEVRAVSTYYDRMAALDRD